MAIRDGRQIGKPLCELLGLNPDRVMRLEVDINTKDVATIKATIFIVDDQIKEITRLFKMAEWREVGNGQVRVG